MVTYTVSVAVDHATAEALRAIKAQYKISWGELMVALLWIYNNKREVFEEALRQVRRPSKEELLLKLANEYMAKGHPLTKVRLKEWLRERGLPPSWAYELMAVITALKKLEVPKGVEKKVVKVKRSDVGAAGKDEVPTVVNGAKKKPSAT